MSVINNVLKDLETRESGFAPIDFPALENRVERRPAWRPLILVLLVLSSIVAAGWYYRQSGLPFDPLRWWQESTAPPAMDQAHLTAAEAPPAVTEPESAGQAQAAVVAKPKASPPAPETPAFEPTETAATMSGVSEQAPLPNQIIGLQIHEADAEMHLEFALREKVIAYVTERSENVFSYHLRDIESQIVSPVLRDNRWLQSLSIAGVAEGVDIRFETVDGILVETRQRQADDEHIWRISFRQPEPVVSAGPVVEERPAAVVAAKPASEIPASKEAVVADAGTAVAPTPVAAAVVAESEAGAAAPESAGRDTAAEEPGEVRVDIRATSLNANDVNRLRYALELINSGRQADAEQLLRSLLASSEDHAARMHLLALYGHQNRHDRLARLAQNSLARYPGDSVFLTEYARSRYQAKAYRVALELLSGVPRFNADQHALAAACHQRLENHERAVEHYRRALELDAGNAKNWVGLGISQEQIADLDKALQSYRNAMKLGTLNERLLTFVEKRSASLAQVLK